MAESKLHDALIKARKAMKDPRMSGSNPHFQSSFVPRDEVLAVVINTLLDHGIFLTQGYNEGALVTRVIGHGEILTLGSYPVAPRTDDQKFMAAGTYASRGSLMLAFGLAGDKDDDGNTAAKPAEKVASKWERIVAAAKKDDAKAAALKDYLEAEGLTIKSQRDYDGATFDVQDKLALIAGV